MKYKLGLVAAVMAAAIICVPIPAQAGGGAVYIISNDLIGAVVGTYYSGRIDFQNDNGAAVYIDISNLPPGISINGTGYNTASMSGYKGVNSVRIEGAATAPGTYTMFVSIREQNSDVGGQAFVYLNVSATTPASCRINNFSANPATITVGQSSTLSWSTSGCQSAKVLGMNAEGNIFTIPLSTSLSGSISTGSLSAPAAYFRVAASSSNSADPVSAEAQSNVSVYVQTTPTVSPHPQDTNILAADGTVYRIMGNARSPYTSAGAFLSYKFNTWASVVPANSADMALMVSTYTPSGANQQTAYYIPPRNGSLINDKGTVYLITNGLRAGFASERVFKELGFTYANVTAGDTSFMVSLAPINSAQQPHPDGTLINDTGTLYVMKNGNRMGFPSLVVLDSWGYSTYEAAQANPYDKQTQISGVIQIRMATQLSI